MNKTFDFTVRTRQDLTDAVQRFGFVPLFSGSIPGFSVEEHAVKDVWYTSESGDWKVWDWKGPVIRETSCAYGKFLENKAVFISREWFFDFANYRRDGYDFDARWDDGLVRHEDKYLYELIEKHGPVMSKTLKVLGDYRKGKRKGFDTSITRLQAQGYVLITDFLYEQDKQGNEYGWGIAQYSIPEQFFGPSFREKVYSRTPGESYERLFLHLKALFPEADERLIRKVLK